MTAIQLIETIEACGGRFIVDGDRLRCRLPADAQGLIAELKAQKAEIIHLLKSNWYLRLRNDSVRSVVYLDVPCNCDERPYPHFRHSDGTGPASGHKLEPENPQQAHASRKGRLHR